MDIAGEDGLWYSLKVKLITTPTKVCVIRAKTAFLPNSERLDKLRTEGSNPLETSKPSL